MIFSNDKISIRQMISIVILDIFGTSIIVLPQKAAILNNQNGWIIVLLTSLLAILATILITTLCQKEINLNFYEHTKKNLTKPVAIIIMFMFVIKNVLIVSYELSAFTSMTSQILLPTRNFVMIFGSMIVIGAYCAMQGIETRARLSEILVFLLLASLFISLILTSLDADFTNILPIQIHSDVPYFKYSIGLMFTFMGLEYLYLIYPYVSDKSKYRSGAIKSVAILGVLMTAITIIATATYNYVTLMEQRWPVLDMISQVNIIGAYFERQDALIMSFWIIGVFSSVTAGIYYSSVIIMDLIPKAKTKYVITILAIVIFVVTDIYMGVEVDDVLVLGLINGLLIFFLFIFPIVSLTVAKAKEVIKAKVTQKAQITEEVGEKWNVKSE